ncbi:MAG: PKD domain-containing protein [Armatimonadota bacterium]
MATRSLCLMVLAALTVWCGFSEVASAADEHAVYYVAPDGDDADPGTREAPWRTPERAGAMAEAGDTVVFMPGEYSGRLTPRNSGTAEAPIVFRAEQRRTAVLIGHEEAVRSTSEAGFVSLAEGGRIEIAGLSHITLRGFEVIDTSETGGEGGWARIVDSSHISIVDCAFSRGQIFNALWVENCEQVRLVDNDLARITNASDFWRMVNCRKVLIEGNSFSRVGHSSGRLLESQDAVVRGNVFHSGRSRNFEIGPTGCERILVENNILANQLNGGRAAGPVNQFLGERLIFRFNQTFDGAGRTWSLGGYSRSAHTHNRTYHNLFHANGGVALLAGTAYGNFRDLVLQNNIFDRNDPHASGTHLRLTGGGAESFQVLRNVIYSGEESADALVLYGRAPLSLAAAEAQDRWAAHLEQPVTRTVAAGSGRSLPVADASAFARLSEEREGRIAITVGELEDLAAVVGVDGDGRLQLDREIEWEADAPVTLLTGPADPATFADNMEVDPGFADAERLDFSLAEDSPLRDAGAPMTVTRAAGSGNVLPVEDPYPFYDGYGIEGERGDAIAVGSSDRRARVVEVDAEARTLRLDRELQWAAGDPVSFPWSGAAPDIGVVEHGEGARAGVQVMADRVRIEAGETVTLRAVVRGMAPPFEYEWHLGDGTVAEGETVVHRYTEARDYGVRVRVTDADGERQMGVGYVDAQPSPSDDVLIHTTFDADDTDWHVHWQFYRGRRTTGNASYRQVLDEETGDGHMLIYPRDDPAPLPAFIHPRGWEIDKYPTVRVRYRIREGTPVAIFVLPFPSAWHTLWDMDAAQDTRRFYLAGTPDAAEREAAPDGEEQPRARGPLPRGPFPQQLIADGEWHEISFDVRDIRNEHPEVQVLQGLHIGDLEVDGGARVGPSDQFALDEIYIGN